MVNFNRFEDLDLIPELLRGIHKMNYYIPTNIQKAAIPVALSERDIVVMAKTGSGKTATFLIPLLQKLKKRSSEGIRALIISPTRDLAIQTSKFCSKLGLFLDLACAIVVGGESIDNQFMGLLQNPDIVIGTPGRLLHVITEMSLVLKNVEIVIFDEADRLYEMGFVEDMKSILRLTSKTRQIMLISATLPKNLIQLSSLEMNDPEFIRLDVDTCLSQKLRLFNIFVNEERKISTLVYLLKNVIDKNDQTIIFANSKYHVDLLHEALSSCGISCSVAYSRMDEESRRINVSSFRSKVVTVLISTDIAARGIDIPSLDNIINYNFPVSHKLFIHRAGRVARVGTDGKAYSLVSLAELPFLIDLYKNIGKELKFTKTDKDENCDDLLGTVPNSVIDDIAHLYMLHENNNIVSFEKKMKKFQQKCDFQAVKAAKSIDISSLNPHSIFITNESLSEKPLQFSTIGFKPKSKPIGNNLDNIFKAREGLNITLNKKRAKPSFDQGVRPKISKNHEIISTNKKFTDHFCLSSRPKNDNFENLYKLDEFKNPDGFAIDFIDDDTNNLKPRSKKTYKIKWDRRLKRHINVEIKPNKKVKTESGIYVDSSYHTDHYKKWLKKTGIKSVLNSKNSEKNLSNKLENISKQIQSKSHKTNNKKSNHKQKSKIKHKRVQKFRKPKSRAR